MSRQPAGAASPRLAELTREELKSLTHGEFWIPEAERSVYQAAMRALNAAGVRYVVSGLYAIYEYTGIYRETKDLDLLLEPESALRAAAVLKEHGFRTHLKQSHWLAKAAREGATIDLIWGMGNGLFLIDGDWYRHSRAGILAATPVRVAPPEELLWHRLFISERHRFDMAEVIHILLMRGDQLDWERLLERTGEHWPLLLAQVHFFDYAYPGHRSRVPDWVREELYERAYESVGAAATERNGGAGDARVCRGTLVSRFSFAIDVNEWGFRDLRSEAVERVRRDPEIRAIARSDVWDEIDPD
jgi:hypothetical protein